jgi:long-chain acyl-CoA synthetase
VDTLPTDNPFVCLERNAQTNPSGVFVETVDNRILNSEALVHVKKLAFELRYLGVKPGDLIALELPDSIGVLFVMAAYHEACATAVLPRGFVPNAAYTVDWMFTTTAEHSANATRTVSVDAQFIQRVDQNPYGISARAYPSDDSIFRLSFSSGTTGTPKAMTSSLGRMASNSVNALETWMEGDPFLVFFGLAASAGHNAFCLSVLDGRPFLSVGNSGASAIVDLAARNSVTSLKASPAQLEAFVEELEKQKRTLPHVQSIYTMGTVMPPALSARLREATGGCEVYTLYGSTEATIATVRYYDSFDPFDAGHAFPGTEIEIVDEMGEREPDGAVGRIRLKTPHMVHSYFGDPDATAKSFKDGWFYPGDLGLIREDGGLTLAGRSSEILNAGGVKIDPTVLDLFARAHPSIVDAASFTYVSTTGIDQIGIALVSEDDLDVAALIQDFKMKFGEASPQLVARVPEIPRNATGKPLRLELAEKYAGS